MVDIVNESKAPSDLQSDHTWEYWLTQLKGFDFVLMEPVCSTFSPARRHALTNYDAGPRLLRSNQNLLALNRLNLR